MHRLAFLVQRRSAAMIKISRNQSCPCRSGKKYKHCCLPMQQAGLPPPAPVRRSQVSLQGEIEKIQEAAARCEEQCRELGVFIFFSTKNGDAWLLETTECDAVQVAAAGQPLPPPVLESQELIEVDWSHAFTLRQRRFFLTDHKNGGETELLGAPTLQISAAWRRIRRHYSAELLRQVHLPPAGDD